MLGPRHWRTPAGIDRCADVADELLEGEEQVEIEVITRYVEVDLAPHEGKKCPTSGECLRCDP